MILDGYGEFPAMANGGYAGCLLLRRQRVLRKQDGRFETVCRLPIRKVVHHCREAQPARTDSQLGEAEVFHDAFANRDAGQNNVGTIFGQASGTHIYTEVRSQWSVETGLYSSRPT